MPEIMRFFTQFKLTVAGIPFCSLFYED